MTRVETAATAENRNRGVERDGGLRKGHGDDHVAAGAEPQGEHATVEEHRNRGGDQDDQRRARGDDRVAAGAELQGERATDVERHPRADRDTRGDRGPTDSPGTRASRRRRGGTDDVVFETFRLEVGHAHGVKPGNIVGAIANEAGLEGRHIGQVDIRDDHSFVDLPEGMPKDIFRNLKKVRVAGQELRISRVDAKPPR